MNPNIIYGLVDPRTLMVRYVGQTSLGVKRLDQHGQESKLKIEARTHKARWIRELQSMGLQYSWVILEEADPAALNDREQWWIAYGKLSCWPLTNLTIGGDGARGFKQSQEAITKRVLKTAAALRGRKISEEHRARLIAANTGAKRSDQARQNMREAQRRRVEQEQAAGIVRVLSDSARAKLRGRTSSAETRAKQSAALRGRKASPESVAKRIGRKMPPEGVAKSSAARRGAKRSEESKQRMREARLRFLAQQRSGDI